MSTNTLSAGDQAPDFDAAGPGRGTRPPARSARPAGRPLLLSQGRHAGCTTQACGIRDRAGEYDAAGAIVLGVSPDPVKAVKSSTSARRLNFTLLADADHAVAEQYGVWGEKLMYGKTYMGEERSTFVIGADGVVTAVLPQGAAQAARRPRAGR